VGLTTRDEARYWVAGAASRFEHYERLHARRAAALPTHFIVYPEWMALDAVLGWADHLVLAQKQDRPTMQTIHASGLPLMPIVECSLASAAAVCAA